METSSATGQAAPSAPESLPTSSLVDELAFRLQQEILEGKYSPGAHILQDELSERFGISRTPVREALRKLQAQGLVVLIPNKGARVRLPTRQELSDVYDVRAELEGFASELASKTRDSPLVAALDEVQGRIEAVEAQFSRDGMEESTFNERMTQGNREFHGLIHLASGNERLRTSIEDLEHAFPKDYVWRALGVDMWPELNEQHVRIRDAIAARSGSRARKEMREHVLYARSALIPYLEARNFWK